MKKLRMIALALLAGALAFTGSADETTKLTKYRLARDKPVVPGYWHADLNKCIAYAQANKVPLIAVWSNGDLCGHCMMFEICCNDKKFMTWQRTSGCVFFFASSYDGDYGKEYGTVYKWCQAGRTTAGYPYIRVYWPAGKVDTAASGDDINKGYGDATGVKNTIAWFQKKIKGFVPKPPIVVPKYTGGAFSFTGADTDRLEAEAGATKQVVVPLLRTNAEALKTVSTNYLVTVSADGQELASVRVDWAAGDTSAEGVVPVPQDAEAGEIRLILQNASHVGVQTNRIVVMEEPENSPKNPRWIGERTADDLAWGEWTMDLDAATNKVAAYEGEAYTLMLIGGPLWCPDCVNVEKYLTDTDEFREFATNRNRIACVAIDAPPFAMGERAPTLLSRDRAATADGKKYWPETSGLGYLSRKEIPVTSEDGTNATAVLERNLGYIDNDVLHGGFCPPAGESGAGKWKTGIPCLILLRDDGSIAGRIYQFSNSTAAMEDGTATAAMMVKRLQEMIELAENDDYEEKNDTFLTTGEVLHKRETIADRPSLSFADQRDIYRLDDAETAGMRMKFTVFGPGSSRVKISIHNNLGTEVTNAVASLEANPVVAAEVASNYYVSVSYETDDEGYPVDPTFALTNATEQGSVLAYSIKSDFSVVPTEKSQTVTIDDDTGKVWAYLTTNEMYRLTNIASLPEVLELVDEESHIYRALVETGDYELTLANAAEPVEYQLWHPGTIGFSTPSTSVSESDGAYTILLTRKGGTSGRVKLTLAAPAVTPAAIPLADVISLPSGFYDEIVWEDGDTETTKRVTVGIVDNKDADGNVLVTFGIAGTEGLAETDIGSLRLTIRDNDKRSPGQIAIVGSNPASGARMTTYVPADREFTVTVGRVNGTTDSQTVTLTATVAGAAGAHYTATHTWVNRNDDDWVVTIPALAAGKKATISLVPAKGSAVDAARRVLTVAAVADAPAFAQPELTIDDAVRYIPLGSRSVLLDADTFGAFTPSAKCRVAVYEGQLAPGLSANVVFTDATTCGLVISGTPTKAGSYAAVYRITDGTRWSLPVRVSVDVLDAAVSGGGETGKSPLNASVGVTRIFQDVPVFEELGGETNLVGTLSMTVPPNGRMSAKFFSADGTAVAFSSASWTGTEPDASGLTFVAQLLGKLAGASVSVTVRARPDGVVAVEFPEGLHYTCETPAQPWSKTNHAADFRGYYTVSLPLGAEQAGGYLTTTGTGYLVLKMNTKDAYYTGSFKYAGMLPNGKTFSGKAVITPRDRKSSNGKSFWNRALLPVICASKTDTLTGVLELSPGAYDATARDYVTDGSGHYARTGRCYYRIIRRTVRPAKEASRLYWRHVEDSQTISFETALDAYGTYYNAADVLYKDCDATLGIHKLIYFLYGYEGFVKLPEETLGGEENVEFKRGEVLTKMPSALSYVGITYDTKKKTNGMALNVKTMTLAFNPATGLVSGKFAMKFDLGATWMAYQGVVLPGFGVGTDECQTCGPARKDAESALCPFISGSAWCNDVYTFDDARQTDQQLIIRRSYPFSVGVKVGE